MKKNAIIIAVAVGAALAMLAAIGAFSYPGAAASQDNGLGMSNGTQGNMMNGDDQSPAFVYKLNKKYHDYANGVFKVRAGAGGSVGPMTMFFPQHAEIKAGESVMFTNPTRVAEPHTVTFIMDNNTFADFGAPFVVGSNTTFTSPDPNANAAPVLMPGPGGQNMIVGLNNRSFSPTVIDSQGKVSYLPPNANYTFTGTEKYVNSGFLWPKGMAPQGFPPIDSFTVTFTKPGTYGYLCEVHPWMSGTVDVK